LAVFEAADTQTQLPRASYTALVKGFSQVQHQQSLSWKLSINQSQALWLELILKKLI